jgi:hypothetical protein
MQAKPEFPMLPTLIDEQPKPAVRLPPGKISAFKPQFCRSAFNLNHLSIEFLIHKIQLYFSIFIIR